MTTRPISMSKLHSILRLKYSAQLSHREIARSLNISPGTVANYLKKANELGLNQWPIPEDKQQNTFFNTKLKRFSTRKKRHPTPDWLNINKDLKQHKHLTLQLVFDELLEKVGEPYYSYSHFCRAYKQWLGTQRLSMRQQHKGGEKLFVDYCGPTITITCPTTQEKRTAQIFVAVLGASNYTYAEATYSQQLEDWVMSHARCFEFLGGVPDVVIPDNLRSAVSKTCRYEPDLNPTYHQLAEYFNVAVIPARPYKPKDKSKAEVGVQIVERWIMARLRNQIFHSLAQLNHEIAKLLDMMNNKVMKQYQQSRKQLFDMVDKNALKPLPEKPYQYTQIKTVRVHIDYHVEIEKHYYSVPYLWVKKQLRAHISNQLVQLYYDGALIAQHPRSNRLGGHTTQTHHMPKAHQKQHEQSPINLRSWALSIGDYTHQVVELLLNSKRHPEQAYRTCLGVLSLAKTYSKERLERACYRAICMNTTTPRSIKQMLQKGLDQQPLPTLQTEPEKPITHSNIRGTDYYH